MPNKIHITVDVDWGSTGIWIKGANSWGNDQYKNHPIPTWLVERFQYWCDWYNSHATGEFDFEEETWIELEAYKLSLAIDLRRVLDSQYVVYVWDNPNNNRIEVTQKYSQQGHKITDT